MNEETKYAYHVTKRENLAEILKEGLKPFDHLNFPHLQGPSEFSCRTCGTRVGYSTHAAVYVFLDDFTAEWWARFRAETYGEDWVVLKLDVTGMELREDWKLPYDFFRSFKISEPIPKDRISVYP